MKQTKIIFGLIILAIMSSCAVLGTQKRNWTFIQTVGGIKTEKPFDTYDGWYLPVELNVTGLEEITVIPTRLNSALECSNIDIKKKDSLIFLTVQTGLAGLRTNDRSGKAVNIGKLKSGKYFVFYKYREEINPIDTFEIIHDEFYQLKIK